MLNHPYTGALRQAGFVRARRRSLEMTRKFAIMPGAMDAAELEFLSAEHASIHMVLGDSDMI